METDIEEICIDRKNDDNAAPHPHPDTECDERGYEENKDGIGDFRERGGEEEVDDFYACRRIYREDESVTRKEHRDGRSFYAPMEEEPHPEHHAQ